MMIFLLCLFILFIRVNLFLKFLGVNNFLMKVVNSFCNILNVILILNKKSFKILILGKYIYLMYLFNFVI